MNKLEAYRKRKRAEHEKWNKLKSTMKLVRREKMYTMGKFQEWLGNYTEILEDCNGNRWMRNHNTERNCSHGMLPLNHSVFEVVKG